MKINNIIDENILFLMEVGASVSGSEAKDIDYIAVVKDLNLFRKKLENSFGEVVVLDDSFRIVGHVPQLNFAIFSETNIFSRLYEYSNVRAPLGECREWVVGYWIPEIFVQDIINGKVIINKLLGKSDFKKLCKKQKEEILINYKKKIRDELLVKSRILEHETSICKKEILKTDLILAIMRYIQINLDERYLNFSKLIDKHEVFVSSLIWLEYAEFLSKLREIIGYIDEGEYNAIDLWHMET